MINLTTHMSGGSIAFGVLNNLFNTLGTIFFSHDQYEISLISCFKSYNKLLKDIFLLLTIQELGDVLFEF